MFTIHTELLPIRLDKQVPPVPVEQVVDGVEEIGEHVSALDNAVWEFDFIALQHFDAQRVGHGIEVAGEKDLSGDVLEIVVQQLANVAGRQQGLQHFHVFMRGVKMGMEVAAEQGQLRHCLGAQVDNLKINIV